LHDITIAINRYIQYRGNDRQIDKNQFTDSESTE
jgi:hypothetical protein